MKVNYKFITTCTIIILFSSFFSFSDSTSVIDIFVGESFDLNSYLVEDKQISGDVKTIWKSGDESVLKVDSDGKVTALKEARTYISAVADHEARSSSAIVIINVKSAVKSIEFINKKVSLLIDDSFYPDYKLVAFNEEDTIFNKNIRLVSANEDIVKIDNLSKVIALKPGKTRVFAYTEDGGRTDSFEVEVVSAYDKIFFKNIKANQVFYVGESVLLEYVDENNKDILSPIKTSFLPSKPGIISYANSTLKFESQGELRIDARHDGIKDGAVFIKIKSLVDKVEIDKVNIKFDRLGDKVKLNASLIPAYKDIDIIEDTIVWSSSDSKIASVDQNGMVESLGVGIARVKARSKDGGHEDYVSVEVIGDKYNNIRATSIDVWPIKDECMVGEEVYLNTNIVPSESSNKNLSFKILKGRGKVVSKDGAYYFKGDLEGNVLVRAVSATGPTDEFNIRVVESLDKIEYYDEIIDEKQRNVLYLGQSEYIDLKFMPKHGFLDSDILNKDYTVVSSSGTLSIFDKVESGFKVRANSVGIASLTIKSDVQMKEEKMLFEVRPLLDSIDVDDEVTLRVSEKYKIKVDARPLDNLYNFTEVFDSGFATYITGVYISRDYINDEVNYEKEAIKELEEIISSNSLKYGSLKKEIERRQKRLDSFDLLLNLTKAKYIPYIPNPNITNRLGESLRVYSLVDNQIVGYVNSYVNYMVKSKDGEKTDKGKIIFAGNSSDFVVVKDDKIVAASNENLKDEIEDEKNKLDEILKEEKNRLASKEDALNMLLDLYESSLNISLSYPKHIQFKDDRDGIITKSYYIGLVSRTNDRYYYPDEYIKLDEFNLMYNKFLIAIRLKGSEEESAKLKDILDLEIQDMFDDGLTIKELEAIKLKIMDM